MNLNHLAPLTLTRYFRGACGGHYFLLNVARPCKVKVGNPEQNDACEWVPGVMAYGPHGALTGHVPLAIVVAAELPLDQVPAIGFGPYAVFVQGDGPYTDLRQLIERAVPR